MNETPQVDEVHRSRTNMRRTRWVLVGLSALLSVVLIAYGAVLIGAIIGVMAAVRAWMIFQYQRNGPRSRPRR